MRNFHLAIAEKLVIFSPFLKESIVISADCFTLSHGTVADFVREIEQTVQLVNQKQQALYVEFHTQRLIQQFDCLKQAVDKLARHKAAPQVTYRSPYRFAKNLQTLPRCKRLEEYHRALRALNDKLSWLIEQTYATQNDTHRAIFYSQIQETEYRKQKCLAAINELE